MSWKALKRPLEFLLWTGALVFVALRFGPQVTAALGIGGGEEELSTVAFQALDGSFLDGEDLKGSVVLLNIWATWCPPCVIEMPGFQRVYDDYKDEGFLVLGVSRDHGNRDRVEIFLREKEITYPVAMAGEVDFGGLTDVETLPTSYLIGRDGTIRHRVEGLYPGPTLRLAVRRLLAEE